MRTVKWNGHDVAEAAARFPLIEGPRFTELTESIKRDGLLQPIWRCWIDDVGGTRKSVILDGRNRLRACESIGLKPTWHEYEGLTDDRSICLMVAALNIQRRDLSKSERAMIAADLVEMYAPAAKSRHQRGTLRGAQVTNHGRSTLEEEGSAHAEAAAEAAAAMGVGRNLVYQARAIKTQGANELIAAVSDGAIQVSAAADIARLPKTKQRKAVKKIEAGMKPSKAIREVSIEDVRPASSAAVQCVIVDAVGALGSEQPRDFTYARDRVVEAFRTVRLTRDAHVYIFVGRWWNEFVYPLRQFFEIQDTPLVWKRSSEHARSRGTWMPSVHQYVLVGRAKESSRPFADDFADVYDGDSPERLIEAMLDASTVEGEYACDPVNGSEFINGIALALGRSTVAEAAE